MWILAIINALGLLSGAILHKTVMYILFGISFVAFSHKYAQLFWGPIYEKESQLVDTDGKVNMKIANEFVCFFCLAGIYYLLALKGGTLCVVVSALQCMVFLLMQIRKQESQKDIMVLISFVVEFLVSFIYLI